MGEFMTDFFIEWILKEIKEKKNFSKKTKKKQKSKKIIKKQQNPM